MANTSIGGLVSGLDTASIITQLMQLEARPQTMLKTRVGVEQKAITSLQSVNAKLAAIASKAADLAKASAWTPVTATSSNDKVKVTTSSGAAPATLTLTVDKVASSTTWDLGLHALTDKVLSDGSRYVTFARPDGSTIDLDTGDGSVQGLVNAINSSASGASASLVKVDSTNYRLVVTAGNTGATTMGLAAKAPSTASVLLTGLQTPGTQAQITVGPDVIKQDSNTFTGLMPGVDVTLLAGAQGTPATTITIAQDSQAMTDRVKALVDAVNGVLDEVSSLTAFNSATKTSGPLAGDATLRDVRNQLVQSVSARADNKSLVEFGIQTDRTGKLVFDVDKFKAAYAANPTKTTAMFTTAQPTDPVNPTTVDGFAATLTTVSKRFSDSLDGTLTNAIKGRSTMVDRMQDDIEGWDVRLAQRKSSLERQYGALEVALGKLQSQSSWLAGQISSLPQMGG